MSRVFFLIIFSWSYLIGTSQTTDLEGKLKVGTMDVDASNDQLVVRQADGTLAQNNIDNVLPSFTVSLTGDTLFQGSGTWVIIPGISAANRVTYRVTFNSFWSQATHPIDFPGFQAHFSGLIGMSHNNSVQLFTPGTLASPGIKSMAETGSKSLLSNEIDLFIDEGSAQSEISGGGIGLSPGSVSVDFDLTNTHSLISIVSMVAPSPDWYIGIRDINLFENGTWVENLVVDVNIYDSGTDSGITFNSGDQPTVPPVPIFMITDAPLGMGGVVPSMGQMVFERIDNN